MTLIEFYDKVPADNIIAALALRPRRIVFLGQDRTGISELMPRIRRILTAHGIRTSLTMRILQPDSLSAVLETIEDLLTEDDEFVFDFTGGDDTALVALGMLFRITDKKTGVFRMDCRTRQGMLYRLSLRDSSFTALPFDGTDAVNPVQLSLRENILLYGGQIREEMVNANTAAGHPFTEDTFRELNRMWKLCQSDCGFWNSQTGKLGGAIRPLPEDKSVFTLAANMRGLDEKFLSSLVDGGFIRMEDHGKNGFWKCTFSSPYVRDCLTKAGTLLEYKTYMTAMFSMDKENRPFFTDGGAGVVIDWAEPKQKASARTGASRKTPPPVTTRNEIDTLLMRGMTPVFISCKNGEVVTDELYKLGTVAGRFGSRYARRALVATAYFDKDDRNYAGDGTVAHLRSRAEDMHITLIENVHRMSDTEFAAALQKLCAE